MNTFLELIQRGGLTVVAIMLLSAVLYTRCFTVLLGLRRGQVLPAAGAGAVPDRIGLIQRRRDALREDFRHERVTLGGMIAAAPLLGLLGTVSGMVRIFENLSSQAGQKSMEGLAGGISEVLTATESGLAVALPAMLLVYVAHRQMTKRLQELTLLEQRLRGGSEP